MIDISDIVGDPDFTQTITVQRVTGAYVPGGEGEITKTEATLTRRAVVQPATADDVVQYLPEGERTDQAIRIWCTQDIRMSDGALIYSDVVVWQGQRYRVEFSKPWQQHGYWFAIAVATTS